MSKHIVIAADGTWNDPHDAHPTNVLRMARAVAPVAETGEKQVVFYDWGVGSDTHKLLGGATGMGLQKNIEDAYRFIVQNHDPGDKLFLFGFSRGAYTVRCLAGLLNNCGVLKRTHAHLIPKAFATYKKKSSRPGSAEAAAWRAKHCRTAERGIVEFIGVWDTVGALGIPTRVLGFAEQRDLFYDPVLGSNVLAARHAVSIDERRADFQPTLWDPNPRTIQMWFSGVHSDVGGGYEPKGRNALSDIPLAWMADEATEHGLTLEPHLFDRAALNPRASAHRSLKSFWRVLGKAERVLPAGANLHPSVIDRHQAGLTASASLRELLVSNDMELDTPVARTPR